MITLNHVLFPTDLSEQSLQVLPLVRDMVSRFHAKLTVLHVLETPVTAYAPPEATAWSTLINFPEIRRTRHGEFETFGVKELQGIPVSKEFREGDPANEILNYLDEHKVDLVMMPTHGYGSFRRMLLGSVTAKVLHDAKCPVWTDVHPPEFKSPNTYRRILCAVDLEKKDTSVISWAAEFGKQVGAEVRLVHAIPEIGGGIYTALLAYRDVCHKIAHEKLESMQHEVGVNVRVNVREGMTEKVVRDEAIDSQTDLVIIGRGKIQKPLGRLRSSVYAIIRESPCPIISV